MSLRRWRQLVGTYAVVCVALTCAVLSWDASLRDFLGRARQQAVAAQAEEVTRDQLRARLAARGGLERLRAALRRADRGQGEPPISPMREVIAGDMLCLLKFEGGPDGIEATARGRVLLGDDEELGAELLLRARLGPDGALRSLEELPD